MESEYQNSNGLQPTSQLPVIDKDDLADREAAWLDELYGNPLLLFPTFEEEDDRSCYASIWVWPKSDTKTPGRREPFHIFRGKLSGDDATKFRSALKAIAIIYGVDDSEAVALMGNMILLLISICELKAGKTPTLPGPFYMFDIKPADAPAFNKRINHPRFSTKRALEIWLTLGAGVDLRTLWKPPKGAGPGRNVYQTFPPLWMDKEDLDLVLGGRPNGVSLPLQVNSESYAAVQSFSQTVENLQHTGIPMHLTVASPGNPAVGKGPPELPRVDLTEEELNECDRHQFKGQLIIEITGQIAARKSNEVRLGGTQVTLPDADFLLFLRLVVALFEAENGFLVRGSVSGPSEEAVYAPEFIDQALYRLRSKLRSVLQGLDPKHFIETQNSQIRLSTHRRYIQVDRSRLLNHPNARIQELAARLPEG